MSCSKRPCLAIALYILGVAAVVLVVLVRSSARQVETLETAGRLTITRRSRSRPWLWLTFAGVHAWLAFVGVGWLPARTFYDIDLYRFWIAGGLDAGSWPVLDSAWVYPVGALVPMLVPAVVSTTSTIGYALGWCALVTALDAVAVRALVRRDATGAWWWLAFLALLGPVAMGRIDAILAPIVILALLVARDRPRVAAALVTVGAWIKVAPGVLLLPLLLIARRPVRDAIVPAAMVCAGIVGAVAIGGGLPRVASFLTAQDSRALQVEAVAASPWVLASLVRDDVALVFNDSLITWEVIGPGAVGAARLLDVVLPLAAAGLAVLLWRARRRPLDVLVWGSLAFATLLIVVNKVGSPQYIGWLAPPVAVGLAIRAAWPADAAGDRSRAVLTRVAVAVLTIAGLTQLVFPIAYPALVTGGPAITAVLVVRNLGLALLLGVCCSVLARGSRALRLSSAGG